MIYRRCGRGRGEGGSPEVAPVEGDDGRARASTVGRHGGGGDRLGRRGGGSARDRHGDQHGAKGARRSSRGGDARGRREGSAQRRQATVRGRTSRGVARAGEARRSDHARRPRVASALDVQEHARVGCRAVRTARHPDHPQDGGQAAARPRLQLAGAQQVRRRCPASRPQRAVRAHQREGPALRRAEHPGHLRRHQEEGAGRQLQERRTRVATHGRARAGGRPRLFRPMPSARRSPTASTTSPPTTASSASGSTTTRRCSR